MSTQMYNAKASKARRDARREAGTCVSCGKEKQRGGVSPYNGKVYQTCQRCYDVATGNKRKYRGGNAVPGPDAPVTTTGKHYLVPSANVIGKIMPCNCPDPIILEFANGTRDFFWLQDCTITDLPVTQPQKRKTGKSGLQRSDYQKDDRYPLFPHETEKGCTPLLHQAGYRFGLQSATPRIPVASQGNGIWNKRKLSSAPSVARIIVGN